MSHVRQIGFIDLPSDVSLRILANCDVVDVLRIERTCKAFRDIATTRHLWLTLLRGLPNEFAPDLVPHVSIVSLDCAHLKDLVVRAVRRNRNWNSSSPKVTHEFKVFVKSPKEGARKNINEASIVPGGDYLMVRWSKRFVQLYRLKNSELIWSYPNFDNSSELLSLNKFSSSRYNVDRISDDLLRVLFVAFENTNATLSMKVFEINLRQRCSEKTFDYRLSDINHHYHMDICFHGDHIVIKENTRGFRCFNWRTYGQSKLYPFNGRDGFTIASQLIKGFLFSAQLMLTSREEGSGALRVASIQQAPEVASGQEGTSSLSIESSILDTLPAVTKEYFQYALFQPSAHLGRALLLRDSDSEVHVQFHSHTSHGRRLSSISRNIIISVRANPFGNGIG
ncbi:hypothetical protein DFH11DRAFT_1270624 [Phellopilus nigrolimitatus]|nr:hypothetical protein DFH11DRAFT_1270624 [Phellopilus nigrolimitatus]